VHLADFLIMGKGFAPDKKQAKRLYKKAARSDDVCASNIGKQRLASFDELERILKNVD
jgi:TPR repeat protein